jgi:hypothetical protein
MTTRKAGGLAPDHRSAGKTEAHQYFESVAVVTGCRFPASKTTHQQVFITAGLFRQNRCVLPVAMPGCAKLLESFVKFSDLLCPH